MCVDESLLDDKAAPFSVQRPSWVCPSLTCNGRLLNIISPCEGQDYAECSCHFYHVSIFGTRHTHAHTRTYTTKHTCTHTHTHTTHTLYTHTHTHTMYRNVNPPIAMDTPYRQLSWLYLTFVNSWLLLNPYNLCADWRFGAVPLINSLIDPHNILTLLTLASFSILGFRAITGRGKSDKILVVALALLILPYIPASNLFFPVGFVVAERVLYLPSMGQCLLVGLGARKIAARNRCLKLLLTLSFLSLAVFHGLKTFQRNYDWQTNFHVYTSGIKVNPTNGVLLTNLGIEYADRKNFSYAETMYRRAIEVAPDHSKGYGNLGGLLEALGQDEEAEAVSE